MSPAIWYDQAMHVVCLKPQRASEIAFCLLGPSGDRVCNNNFVLFVVC
jgi:hypothetical protein